MSEPVQINDKYVKLAIAIKTAQLRQELHSLTFDHVESTVAGMWKNKQPQFIHEMIHDIINIELQDVVGYLSTQAMIIGSSLDLGDFDRILSK